MRFDFTSLSLSRGLLIALFAGSVAVAQEPADAEAVWDKKIPESQEELLFIQSQLQEQLENVRAATVNITGKTGSGSGVVVNAAGLILTAGHVNEKPKREVVVRFEDGTEVKGKTLGASWLVDSGMIQIINEGEEIRDWPHIELAEKNTSKVGDWCFALGYPDGYQKDRGIVVRIGRLLKVRPYLIQSDCRLLGGDSGGPLFNMKGQVIGIHSRISMGSDDNFHAPIDAFRNDWDALLAGNVLRKIPKEKRGFFGVSTQDAPEGGAMVRDVIGESVAEKAGLKKNDIIITINNRRVEDSKDFSLNISARQIDEKISLEYLRDKQLNFIEVTLGSWPKFPFIVP